MGNLPLIALRAILALGLAGSIFVQAVMVPLLWMDLDEAPAGVRVPVVAIVVLGILTIQVTMVCVWQLLTLVRRGTVFSSTSFRYVDIIIGAVATASALTFALGFLAAPSDVAPGVVLLIGGLGGLIAGVALTVYVMRLLLAQATRMQDELAEVI